MKRKTNLILSCLALTFSICLMVFGVYAAINPKISVSGQVTYQVRDAKVMVQGKLNGALDSNGVAINGEYPNPTVDATNYTSATKITDQQANYLDYTVGTGTNIADDDLTEWELGEINFLELADGTQDITISLKLTNFSLYPVKATLEYEVDTLTNVTRTQTKTEAVLNPTGEAGDTDEIVITLDVTNVTEDVTGADIGMTLTFQKASGTDAGEEKPEPILTDWSGEWDDVNKEVVLTNYSGDATNIVIPSEIDVTTLKNYSSQTSSNAKGLVLNQFDTNNIYTVVGLRGDMETQLPVVGSNFANITSIYIPASIKEIGDMAFVYAGLQNLEEVMNGILNDQVVELVCSEVNIEFEENSQLKTIGMMAFGASGVQNIVLPDSVEEIGQNAFANTKIENLIISDSVKTIGESAFATTNLKKLTIGNNVQSIEMNSFTCCRLLESVIIGSNVKTIEESAFYDCLSLTTVYYNGTEAEKTNITIDSNGNGYLTNATWYYFDETESKVGNFWHYGDNGEIVVHPAS